MKFTYEMCQAMMDANGGTLDLRGTNATQLPEGLYIPGDLIIENCRLRKFPINCSVRGSIHMQGSKIRRITKGTRLGHGLYAYNSRLAYVPKNFVIPGNCDIVRTRLGSHGLSRGVVIGKNFDIEEDKIGPWINYVRVGGKISNRLGYSYMGDQYPIRYEHYEKDWLFFNGGSLIQLAHDFKMGKYHIYVGVFPDDYVVSDGKCYIRCKNIRDGLAEIDGKKNVCCHCRLIDYYAWGIDEARSVHELMGMYLYVVGHDRYKAETEIFKSRVGDLNKKYTIRTKIKRMVWRFLLKEKSDYRSNRLNYYSSSSSSSSSTGLSSSSL